MSHGVGRFALRTAFLFGGVTASFASTLFVFGHPTIPVMNSSFVPVREESDSIYTSNTYARLNPRANPTFTDFCIKRIPLEKLRPELLEANGDGLITEFSRGVWGGVGYSIQRFILSRKYSKDPLTSSQLYTPSALQTSTYSPGTLITNHFEVVWKTPKSILVRCGDSPLNSGLRESDGLLELSAHVKKDEGVVEFGIKSVFFQGKGITTEEPLQGTMVWAHRAYDRLLLEGGIKKCLK